METNGTGSARKPGSSAFNNRFYYLNKGIAMSPRRISLISFILIAAIFIAGKLVHANEPVGKRLSAGATQSLYVDPEGQLWAWGNVTDGKTKSVKPVKIMDNVKSVSASTGISYSFAVKKDGTAWGWGDNYFGQIVPKTDSSTAYINKPVKVLDDVRIVESGNATVFAIKNDNTLWGWGAPGLRRGDVIPSSSSTPSRVLDNVVMASASISHTIAVDSGNTFWGWGDNRCPSYPEKRHRPLKVNLDALHDRKIVSISSTMGQTFAVTSDGLLWQWGADRKTRRSCLTDNMILPSHMKGIDNIKAIAPGKDYLLILKKDGTVWSWNWTEKPLKNVPKYRQIPLTGIIEIAAGDHHFLALKKDGTVWAAGANQYGQLGNGTTRYSEVPVKVALPEQMVWHKTAMDHFAEYARVMIN